MPPITTHNHGPLIVSSTYWGSEVERRGLIWISINAGAIRVLVPRTHRNLISEIRGCTYVVCSRGPWPATGKADAMELLFDDGTQEPVSLHVGPESVDVFPGEPEPGRQWICTVWDLKKGRPHKAVERPCYWRRVPQLPWLLQWAEEPK